MNAEHQSIVKGMIMLWFGILATIPKGWACCTGENGTPDLRDKFIIGAGALHAIGSSGGNSTHTHDFTTVGHSHLLGGTPSLGAGTVAGQITVDSTDHGTTDAGDNEPPYYALCYIMKL